MQTYVGNVLVAVNPFTDLGLFTPEVASRYVNIASASSVPPHIYAIADNAYSALIRDEVTQVCVISGESGAGKTESAKQFMRQVMDISAAGVGGMVISEHRRRHPIEVKLIATNPILEAFGNAQTVMNHNSSRFGKFIEVLFNDNGQVAGGSLSHYLLEKGRIVKQNQNEGNFHIFKFLFAGCSRQTLDGFHLGKYTDYSFLPAADDIPKYKQEWKEVVESLRSVGFLDSEIQSIVAVVAAVLHLGELKFSENDDREGVVSTPEVLEHICSVLAISPEMTIEALTSIRLELREGIIMKKQNAARCRDSACAFAKGLYGRLFDWLVLRIDAILRPEHGLELDEDSVIGILDVFGFEKFKVNGFDQMCINLANEQLHHFFNERIFADELNAYKKEGVDVLDVYFDSNKECFEMFLRRPTGLLALLDEEATFTHATDRSLLQKFNKFLKGNPVYTEMRGNREFTVKHFAGEVTYTVEGFLEKNKDPLPEMIPHVLMASSNALLAVLLHPNMKDIIKGSDYSDKDAILRALARGRRMSKDQSTVDAAMLASKSSKRGKKKKKDEAKSSVSYQFTQSLQSLMERMGQCEPHFIRCVKPNLAQVPGVFEDDLINRQLHYLGILETVKMRRDGYPLRVTFEEMFRLYDGVVNYFGRKYKVNAESVAELCEQLSSHVRTSYEIQGITPTLHETFEGYLVAKTVVFCKYWHLDILDNLRRKFVVSAIKIQARIRGRQARRRFALIVRQYRDQRASVVSFIDTIDLQSRQVTAALRTISAEERRKGPEQMGLIVKLSKKEEVKLQKKAIKEFSQTRKHFDKELSKCKKNVVKWWQKFEMPTRVHLNADDKIHPWFHGLISRTESEEFLFEQEHGTYLLRVSERAKGYALSFVFNNWIRHYKLEHQDFGGYKIAGADEIFDTINDLAVYYYTNPLSEDNDMLKTPLEWEHDLRLGIQQLKADYMEMPDQAAIEPVMGGKGRRRSTAVMALDVKKEDDLEAVMSPNYYLNLSNNPPWLRGKMSREDAEEELYERGNVDGRYIVREKVRFFELECESLCFRCNLLFPHS